MNPSMNISRGRVFDELEAHTKDNPIKIKFTIINIGLLPNRSKNGLIILLANITPKKLIVV